MRRRRRFALFLSPVAVALLAVGVALVGNDGAVGVVGLIALAQGIGLGVAAGWLAFGKNPLAKG